MVQQSQVWVAADALFDVQSGLARIKNNLGSSVRKGKMSQEAADKVAARVKGTLDYSGFGDVDMVRAWLPHSSARFQMCCMVWAHRQHTQGTAASLGHMLSVYLIC